MLKSRSLGHRPQITFTADCHELVQGDLIAGPCLLRYDPWRIVPESEIHEFGQNRHPIKAYLQFHPVGQSREIDLYLPPGARPDYEADPTGGGRMIKAEFMLPHGCDAVECWFLYHDKTGHHHWDSDNGANHWLRFPTHDLKVEKGVVVSPEKAPTAELQVVVRSISAVDTMTLRWRVTHPCGIPRKECALVATTDGHGHKTWTTPDSGAPVPHGATVVFDLVYTVNDHKFTDDNEGTWYLAE